MVRIFIVFITMVVVFSNPVQAQSTSANFSAGGSIIIGADTRSCTSGLAGSLRWNSSTSCMEYCDGTNDWTCSDNLTVNVSVTNVGCTPDSTCPNVGDVCSGDGTGGGNPKFAGCMCYYDANSADAGTCKALYAAQADQSTSSMWKIEIGTDDITTDSMEDGIINDGQVADSTDFPAFKLCKDLSDGGYTDWYLPARRELDLLWLNKDAITGFASNYYWSSSEFNTSNAWYQLFGTYGYFNSNNKNTSRYVRCVRRD